jgi:hypothetical protein
MQDEIGGEARESGRLGAERKNAKVPRADEVGTPPFHRALAGQRQAPSVAPSSCNHPSYRIRPVRDPGSTDYRRRARAEFAPSKQFPRPWRREPRRVRRLFHREATCLPAAVKAVRATRCLPINRSGRYFRGRLVPSVLPSWYDASCLETDSYVDLRPVRDGIHQ